MIFLYDPSARVLLDANPAACEVLGRKREQLVGSSCEDVLSDESQVSAAARFFEDAKQRGSSSRLLRFAKADGPPIEVEVRASEVRLGERRTILCIGRDLSAQQKLERRSLAFYQAFRNSQDSMFYTDRTGRILDVNDAFTARFGYTREEAIGETPRIVRSRHTTHAMYKKLWGSILDPTKGFWSGRLINRTKGGDELPVILSVTAVRDPEGEIIGFVSSTVDLAEVEDLQQRLSKTESLAAVGSMAAVLAHEIRNPLGSIVSASRGLAGEDLEQNDREELTLVLRKEAKRLNDTLSQFLQYARPRDLQHSSTDLGALIKDIATMVRSDSEALGETELSFKLPEEAVRADCDSDQLRQVLWNIVNNSVQALKGSGRLELRVARDGKEAAITVGDDGPGIPPAELKKIFEPFHTTKQKGTGLGLAVAERIVSSHGGRIEVESVVGEGTRMTVRIPLEAT